MWNSKLKEASFKILNLLIGCLVVSIGVLILKRSGISTGGTVGLSLSATYLLGSSFPLTYCLVNVPFYVLSLMKMGWKFTLSTLFSVTALSLMSVVAGKLPTFILPGWFGAVFGGIIIGLGMTYLFQNDSSLGGTNILALFLQRKYGWNPGKVMFVLDGLIIAGAFYSTGVVRGLLSVLSIVILSFIINLYKRRFSVPKAIVLKAGEPQGINQTN